MVSCNQQKCVGMRKRMEKHQQEHHTKGKVSAVNNLQAYKSADSSAAGLKAPISSNAARKKPGQSNFISIEHNLNHINRASNTTDTEHNCKATTEIPLKISETQNVLVPKRNFYKEHLLDVVLKWFLDIPVTTAIDNATKLKRLKTVHDFAIKIADLSSEVDNGDYNRKVKYEIDKCLANLSMWCPGINIKKDEFEDKLCQALLQSIVKINDKWITTRHDFKRFDNDGIHDTAFDELTISNESVSNVENEILNWVETEIQLTTDIRSNIGKQAIAGIFISRLIPIIKSKRIQKHAIKAEIENVLEELSASINLPKAMDVNTIAIDLADRVVNVINENNKAKPCTRQSYNNNVEVAGLSEGIANVLTFDVDDSERDAIIQITEILLNSTVLVNKRNEQLTAGNVFGTPKRSHDFSEDEEPKSKTTVVTYMRNSLNADSSFNLAKQYLSDSLIVLTSENELLRPFDKNEPLTSTPLMPTEKKEVPKLNPEEKAYLDKIVAVIRTWLDTTDMTFKTTEEQFFKENIAIDMAGDIKDLAKQIQMGQIQDKITTSQYEGLLNYVILRAIFKYGLLTPPVTFTTPQVADLRERVKNIGMQDNMTNPQHGDRQKWANFKFRSENPLREDQMPVRYQPNALDILEDNISVWMNEQPSEIYKDQDRRQRNELLRDVATKVQKKMENKKEDEVKKDLAKWLKKIVNPNIKKDVDNLAEDLKERIIKLPGNDSLSKKMQNKNRARAGEDTDLEPEEYSNLNEGPDQQLKEYIDKFMEHNYDVNDSLVKSALGNILLQELIKLGPNVRTEASNTVAHEGFNPDKFRMELEYIKEVSDWLKNIPFYPLVGSGNDRVEFVNGLAKNIAEIEEERIRDPCKMDYDKILHSEIYEYMVQLPLHNQDVPNLTTCINQLVQRIIRHRPPIPSPYYCSTASHKPTNSTVIQNEQDFAQFIEEFVNVHGKEIGADKLKREAYLGRLLKEIQRMINEKADVGVLTKGEIYERLADVPIPGKESVKRFSIGLGYVQEIAEWLHNFPLIPLSSQEENVTRITMISELSEKLTEIDIKKADNPNDTQIDAELDEYITNWIKKLNLDQNREIVVPILISQLKRRMENVKTRSDKSQGPQMEAVQDVRPSKSVKRTSSTSRKKCCNLSHEIKSEDPGDLIVEAIESWCNELPINEENEDATKTAKAKVATNIFQKVGLLNSDPQAANDDLLYRDILADEVETEIQKLTEKYDISQRKDELKALLLDKIMDTKQVIRDISAGENYKQALENTIDASLPNPVHTLTQNTPGFELYKSRMAMLWLLENYDYAVDFNSLKYKKKLNEDIDFYSDEAQKRNVLPLEKYELFNEVFSALYKQNPPCEHSIIEEVESIKTRCEIDVWFKELPLRKASGFQELLEREQILALLAKRLFDIERKKDPDADEKTRKEIMKWLNKLPLLPGEDKNITQYVDKLICNLKATAEIRKCKRKTDSNRTSVIKEFVEEAKGNQSMEIKDATQLHELRATRKENISQIAGPSGVVPKPCCEGSTAPRKKAGDLITSAIETWCNELPLSAQCPEDKGIIDAIKDETILKMYQLLSDLHTDPHILNSEGLYEHHLNIAIERLLSELPAYSESQQMRNARRARIINELKTVRVLIKDEFDREGYKQDLKHAITSFFDETTKPNKIAVNDHVRQVIADNFIQLSYHRDEFEEQQLYKSKIDDAVAEVMTKNTKNTDIDQLISRNQLICEMAKVKPPNEYALVDEVQEIRMKDEITDLFKEIKIPKGDEEKTTHIDQIKLLLAKKIIDIERDGHNCSNDEKMKTEVTKAFKKLKAKISPEKINAFVNQLKATEDARKAPPLRKDDKCSSPNQSILSQQNRNIPLRPSLAMRSPQRSFRNTRPSIHDTSKPPQVAQARTSVIQNPPPAQTPVYFPQSPNVVPQYPGPILPSPRPAPMPVSPSYRQVTTLPPTGPMSYVPSQYTSRRSYSHPVPISRPSFGMSGPQTAYRQPELAHSPLVEERHNIHLNVPLEDEHAGTRSTARVQESPRTYNPPSCSCQQTASNRPDVEQDIFGGCNCERNRKKDNCQGVCKADAPEYCDVCENDHDCDFDVPMMPYAPMYPYPVPRFMFF